MDEQVDTDRLMKNAGCRLGSWKGILFIGIFRWQHRQTGKFFSWGGAAAPPYQMRGWQDVLFRSGEGRR